MKSPPQIDAPCTVAKMPRCQDLVPLTVAKEDNMISCLREGTKCAAGTAVSQAQMQNFNDGSLHRTHSEKMEEDVTEAAPFKIIKEDDVDDDFELDN